MRNQVGSSFITGNQTELQALQAGWIQNRIRWIMDETWLFEMEQNVDFTECDLSDSDMLPIMSRWALHMKIPVFLLTAKESFYLHTSIFIKPNDIFT